MYKGIITNFHPKSGAGYIKSDDFKDSVYCHKSFVEKNHLKVNELVEFEFEEGPQGPRVTKINRINKQNSLFEKALKIQKLTAKEYDEFCELARQYVNQKEFRDNVTTSKIRNIFSEILKAETEKEIKMLRPKFAYLAGRENKTKFFMNDLDSIVRRISNKDELKSFKQFFEAIICYKKEIEK